jgi:hypothetical protein
LPCVALLDYKAPVTGVSSERLAIGVLFVAIATLGCLMPAQSDTWWLLRAGGDIWRTGSVALEDSYSHTAAGLFWPNHEWLTEVVFYAAHRIGGLPLLAGVAAAAVLAAWGICWRLTPGTFEARFLLFAACVPTSAGAWALRPQVFTLLLFATTCALLAAGRLRWLPVLFVLWTNLHGAVALGVVAVVAALAADLARRRRLTLEQVLVAAACGLATLASPLGIRLWTFIAESTEKSRVNQLVEWTPPDWSAGFWPFWAIAVALPVVAALRWRRLDERTSRLLAVALAVLPLALSSQRNVAVFLLAAIPALAPLVSPADRPGRRPARERGTLNAALLGLTAVGATVFVTLVWLRPPDALGWRPMSPSAAAAIRACEPPLYNTYGTGGFLIWFVPEQRVFIDNRQDPYPTEFLAANRDLEFGADYAPLFRRYGIRCVVASAGSDLARRLQQDPAWAEAYADRQWLVFHPDPSTGSEPAPATATR